MSDAAVGGNDRIEGGGGRNGLGGDALEMSGTSVGGNDTLIGGDEFDVLIGDARFMSDAAVGGNDTLEGGGGDDDLYGDGIRSDSAVGGADVFVFAPGSGLDTIFDFEQGKDLMDVRDYGAQSLADLTIATSEGTASSTSTAPRWTAWATRSRCSRSKPLQQRLHFA